MISKSKENLLAGLKEKQIRYLVVEFGDNDFGIPIVAALQRLWQYVHKNNHREMFPHFMKLHIASKLEPMLMRLFVLEQACFDVEHLTRGLYENWLISELPEMRLEYYLECPVEFSNDLPEPDNGETAWLDLTTGEAQTA